MRNYSSYIGYLILAILLAGCEKKDILPPLAVISIDKYEGETTDYFILSGDNSKNPNKRSELYYRWGFGIDSSWNTLPSSNSNQTFRYKSPGTYLIKLMAINSEGLKDSASAQIVVSQGSSNPRADFEIIPEQGHIFTDFTFDASLSQDDEDSLNTLLFRWDFESDGIWDTEYSIDPVVKHQFAQQNKYDILLDIKDPTGLKSIKINQLSVGLTDYDLFVDFTWTPENGTEKDTFKFDASASYHPDYPEMQLKYMWQIEEGLGWTDTLDEPFYYHNFRTIRDQNVRLMVIEPRGIHKTIEKELYLNPANKKPTARFVSAISSGNIRTQFYYNAWTSSDPETIPSELKIRWDFDGDGKWDTNYSKEKVIYHQYLKAGKYSVILEVMDEGGLCNIAIESILVSPHENETGYIIDGRDFEMYGTVKIGEQWWFAENLRYNIARKMYNDDRGDRFWSPWKPWICLEEYSPYCDLYGKYYHVASAIDNTHIAGPEVDYDLCPRGWRIPYEKDLRKLIDFVGEENGYDKLRQGGDTDFNLQYLGKIDYQITWKDTLINNIIVIIPEDTIYIPKATYRDAYLFSQTEPDHPLRVDVFMIRLLRNSRELWYGHETTTTFIPVRCIKEEYN